MANKKKILIVEDENSLLMALVNKFSNEGFKTVTARNGEDGLKVIKKEKPDLILLDIIMPVMDGMTMLKKLRTGKVGKNIPVIILSNLSDADKARDAAAKGVNDFLIKSDWRLEDVVKKAREALGK